jgi:hypothetical protein
MAADILHVRGLNTWWQWLFAFIVKGHVIFLPSSLLLIVNSRHHVECSIIDHSSKRYATTRYHQYYTILSFSGYRSMAQQQQQYQHYQHIPSPQLARSHSLGRSQEEDISFQETHAGQ